MLYSGNGTFSRDAYVVINVMFVTVSVVQNWCSMYMCCCVQSRVSSITSIQKSCVGISDNGDQGENLNKQIRYITLPQRAQISLHFTLENILSFVDLSWLNRRTVLIVWPNCDSFYSKNTYGITTGPLSAHCGIGGQRREKIVIIITARHGKGTVVLSVPSIIIGTIIGK